MTRPTILDLAKAAGVSISTVDRVLNNRDTVRRATVERVLEAAGRIGFHGIGTIRRKLSENAPSRTFGFLLNQRSKLIYQALGENLVRATEQMPRVRGRAIVRFMEDLTPGNRAAELMRLGEECDAVAAVLEDHPAINYAIGALHEKGKPVFSIFSDVTASARAGYIGSNDWQMGRTAGWFIRHLCGGTGHVAIFVGSYRYLGQQICEMSFRSYLSEHQNEFTLHATQITNENDEHARELMEAILKDQPCLKGVYVAGGGIDGVIQALKDAPQAWAGNVRIIARELTDTTRKALTDGVIDIVFAHPLDSIARHAIEVMEAATSGVETKGLTQLLLPFEIYTSENI